METGNSNKPVLAILVLGLILYTAFYLLDDGDVSSL